MDSFQFYLVVQDSSKVQPGYQAQHVYLFLSLNSLVDICHFSVAQLQDLLLCGHPRGGRRRVGFPTVVASGEQRNPLPTLPHPLPGLQVAASR